MNKTPLYDLHRQHGARFTDFTGYTMPLQYRRGIMAEHLHTRSGAGLFDVSHMGQLRVSGNNVAQALERALTGDVRALKPYRQCYTLLTNEQGGIIDDLMLTRTADGLLLVVNAARRDTDHAYLRQALGAGYEVELLHDRALLALQGPRAAAVLADLFPQCTTMPFLSALETSFDGGGACISRCGYTGEDGFEISLPNDRAAQFAQTLLQREEVALIGLGARDSLRLEAGLCLYGHDIDEATSPVAAGLTWVIAKKYRDGSEPARFPGAEKILKTTPRDLRCGFRVEGKVPVREGAVILNEQQQAVGRITSGGFGPSVGAPVAMGYVAREYAEPGTALQVAIRGRTHVIRSAQLPFIKHRYYRP
ncbi:MAG: glycine cleavage system aminomethyltransferase GcvT [Gammaproteobacteria bacterium]|nr:glycine cleavage system aminomethyltransferase GcvT [Gammaproteobacteria bacterium]